MSPRSAVIIGLGRISLSFLCISFHKCSIGFKSGRREATCDDSDVVLLEKVPGGSGSVGAGIVLLEHAGDGQNRAQSLVGRT